MATAVASRFAVLSLDDDDDFPKKSQPKKKTEAKKPNSAATNQTNASKKKNAKKNESGKGNQNNSNATTNPPKSKGKGGGKSEGNKEGTHKKKGNPVATQEQWDQWKKKDSELVDSSYEQDLHQAIMLSKLDYEENKEHYEQIRKNVEIEKKPPGTGSKKSKKANKQQTMSLDEFNSRGEAVVTTAAETEAPAAAGDAPVLRDTEFFERIKDDAKKALTKEQDDERKKAREPFSQDRITVAQLEDRLEKRNKENKVLKEEVVKLKEELHDVRTRNKKLCNILAQGEMKDKAEVLIEVERLQRMRDELSSEVQTLHAQLEQERSKVRALASESTKGKSQSKKQRSSSETNHQ